MATYRGNIGNLLQHWVLCELIERANKYWTQLRFVDAYSMAPLATERFKSGWSGHLFDHARDRATFGSTYEEAWRKIAAGTSTYPNSAQFVSSVWNGRYSMLLCERDDATVDELRQWARTQESKPNCASVKVSEGDWRRTLKQETWQSQDLTMLSFDPDMFNRHGSDDGRKMTPSDLALVANTLTPVSGAVVVQLSTYDVNSDNSQKDVEPAIRAGLQMAALDLIAVVRTDGQMMSLVFGRSCDLAFVEEVVTLPGRFESWLTSLKASAFMAQPSQRLHPTAANRRLAPLPQLPRGRRG